MKYMISNTADHSFAQPTSEAFIPVSEPIASAEVAGTSEFVTQPGVGIAKPPVADPAHLCWINLKAGCYRITFSPFPSLYVYKGTLRVERSPGSTIMSGDLYRFRNIILDPVTVTSAALAHMTPEDSYF